MPHRRSKTIKYIPLIRYATLIGNGMFILWIVYEAFIENFSGNILEKFEYVVLLILMLLNTFLLAKKPAANS